VQLTGLVRYFGPAHVNRFDSPLPSLPSSSSSSPRSIDRSTFVLRLRLEHIIKKERVTAPAFGSLFISPTVCMRRQTQSSVQ
jgi:hypothetical protein